MIKLKVIDRDEKANFEIKILNKVTGKSKSLSIIAVDETEESLKDRIKSSLDNNKSSKAHKYKEEKMPEEEETSKDESTESESKEDEESEDSDE